MTERVLVTAAYRGELDLLDDLPEGWIASPCGIGGVAAAAGLSMLLTVHQPTRVIALGTCGAVGRGLGIGDIVSPKTVRWVDPSILTGAAHLPPSVYRPLQLTPWHGQQAVCCLQTPSVTLSADYATHLGTQGEPGFPTVEHLELYSMAFVAQTFGIPLTALLGVTNLVGPTGSRDWKANHTAVEKQVQEFLFKHETGRQRQAPVGPAAYGIEVEDVSPTRPPAAGPAPGPAAPKPDLSALRKRWLNDDQPN